MKTITTEDGSNLNILTTTDEIKCAARKDSRASLYVELNEEVTSWLQTINIDNRPISFKDVCYWANMIYEGDWDFDSCIMHMNQSGTRLIDGQHRILAVKSTGQYTMIANLKVVPDAKTKTVFDNQDCNGKKRRVSDVLALHGVVSPRWKQTLDVAWRRLIEGDDTSATAHTVTRFEERFLSFADFLSSQRKFVGSQAKISAIVYIALLRMIEIHPETKDVMLDLFDQFAKGTFAETKHPLYQLRGIYTDKVKFSSRTKKDLLWLTMKAFLLAQHGETVGMFKVGETEKMMLAKEFDISAPSNNKVRGISFETVAKSWGYKRQRDRAQ
jgi:hypothetical protein